MNPDHVDRNPSLHVYPDRFKCFSCGFRGDAIDLVQAAETCDWWTAVERICEIADIPVPRRNPEWERVRQAQREISETLEQVWQAALQHPEPALEYLASRGIPESASQNRVGYLPSDYQPPDLDAAARGGLLSKTDHFLMAGRAIFAITNAGRIVGLYGRALDPDVTPHHMCSGATDPPMPAGLWGLDEVRKAECYLTESPIDALTLVAHGLPAASLTGAEKFNAELATLLSCRKIENITLCFDTDDAGRKGARRAGELLFRAGIDVRVVEFPMGTDE